MPASYGVLNPKLTKAVNELAKSNSDAVLFVRHAEEQMDERGFDHLEVLECLRRGKVMGPEMQGNELRANVVHRGLHIRVAIGDIEFAQADWSQLDRCKVVTVMRES